MNIINYIKDPKKILYILDNKNIIRINDREYLKLKFKIDMKSNLDLNNPKTFNEKLQWLKLNDQKDIYTKMVDKYEAKKYVSDIIGSEYIIPTLGIYSNFDDINFNSLPDKFVIKCTHDSGGVFVIDNKKEMNHNLLKKTITKSLKNNFYYRAREWPYKNIKPRIILEKYMGDNLNDYKLFCFNGVPKFILVCSNRNGNDKNTDFYDINWNLLPFTRENHVNNKNGIKKPKYLNLMLDISKKLSKNIPFVRIDLYEIENKVYFGELTFYPSGGFEGFNPKEWDKKLGDMIKLPNKKE